MKYKRTTLKNGLRIITVPTKGNPSVTVFVLVETGSDYESKRENGLSHFLEHMCFKGTTKRPTIFDVSLEFDQIGAENNAFTSNEWTGYYAKANKKHFKKILDVVSDMYLEPKINESDIEKERGVIIQEINMYEDQPQSQVWDELSALLYGDTPSGRTVVGSIETVSSFSREDFVNYRKKHYVAEGTVVVVVGDLNEKMVVDEVKKYFSLISTSKKHKKLPVKEKQKSPEVRLKTKATEQTHMVLAFRSFDSKSKNNSAVSVLASILGNGLSSRLWQRVRTKMGACYYIGAHAGVYTDHGSFSIPTGIDKSRAEEVIRAILEECNEMKKELVSKKELDKAKEYLVGHLYMGLESTHDIAHFMGIDEAIRGKARQVKDIEKSIRAVTAEQVRKVAREIFQNKNLNLAVVGDIKDGKKLKKVLSLDK